MAFRSLPFRNRWQAIAAAIVLALLALLLALNLLRGPLGPGTVLTGVFLVLAIGLLAVLLFRLWALRGLDYWVELDAVRIMWAGDVVTIPLGEIQSVDAHPVGVSLQHSWRKWPAGWVQPVSGGRRLAAYSSQAPADGLLLNTRRRSYLLSPTSIVGFTQAVEERQQFGATRLLDESVETPFWRRHWFVSERLAQVMIAIGLLLGLLLLAAVIWRFPSLPAEIPLHFDAAGIADRVAPHRSLLVLPAITLMMWALNVGLGLFLYERSQRLAAYLLWANAILIQVAGLFVLRKLLEMLTF